MYSGLPSALVQTIMIMGMILIIVIMPVVMKDVVIKSGACFFRLYKSGTHTVF